MLIVSEEGLKEENMKIKSRVVIFGVISIFVMMISTYFIRLRSSIMEEDLNNSRELFVLAVVIDQIGLC